MAAPTFASAGTALAIASAATADFAVPSSVAAGDIVIVSLFIAGNPAPVVTPPTGFTEATSSPGKSAGSQASEFHVYWKRATAADTGTYGFVLASAAYRWGAAVRYTGCITTGNPFEGAASAGTSTDTTTTPALSATTTGTDRTLLWTASHWNAATATPPPGFTSRSSAGGYIVSDLPAPTATTYGPYTGTWSASGGLGVWIGALLPPPATPGAGYEARSNTGMRYRPHVLLGGSPVEMSFNPQPVQLKDWAQFPTTSTLSANYNNATLPAGSGSAVTIPGWTISTTSLPMRAAYYMKVKPTYEFDTVTATPDTTVGVYRQPNTAMEGTVTLAAQQIPLGGTRYRSDPAPKTLSIAFGVSDPAVSVTYEARLYASVAGANLYMPAGGSYMTFLPCVLDAVSDIDKTVNARRTSMWNHRLIETNTDLFNITSSGITLLTPTAGGGWVMRITYTLVCSVSIPSITFGISRSDGFWGNSQAAAITTPVGDGTFKYTGVIDCTPASFASNTLAFPAIGVNPAAPVTLKAGCRIQIIAP